MRPSFAKVAKSCQRTRRCRLEVGDIFRRYGDRYRTDHKLSVKQASVMFDIEQCRSSYFGYHIDICDQCGLLGFSYNSCRNPHCPNCQGIAQCRWVNARLEDLLPIAYYHVTFTLPHRLNALVGYNRRLIYDLLFDSAAETLLQFGRDPKWLGALIGFYGVLHTWGGKLWQHLHVHFIVSGGGLSDDGRWMSPKYPGKFIFPVRALSRVFRGKFIEGLKQAYSEGGLVLAEDLKHLQEPRRFEQFVDALVARNWVVFAKRPFAGAEKFVRYIGRYTHRVAISNHRLIGIKNDRVHFKFKDYRDKGLWKATELSASEFIRRFLLHVLPEGFHRIRHYGFLSNGRCKTKVAQIRKLLPQEDDQAQETEDDHGQVCPQCAAGRLTPYLILHRMGVIIREAGAGLYQKLPAFDTS